MHAFKRDYRVLFATFSTLVALLMTGCGTMEKMGLGGKQPATVELTGAQEVPPVSTKASGRSTISVADDKSVSGSVIIDNMTPTAAHIHQGAAGTNGPVIIPLTRTADKTFTVPANTKLTDAQHAAYKAGNLYINVHSAAYPAGEIRAQMKP
jgi:hypothetical protein